MQTEIAASLPRLACMMATTLVSVLFGVSSASAHEYDVSPLCLKTSFLDAVVAANGAQAKDLLRRLTDPKGPYRELYVIDAQAWCYTSKADQVCPRAGRLLIWRNRGQDLWFPIEQTSEALEQQLLTDARQLGSKLNEAFSEESQRDPTAYTEPRILLDQFSGETCLPPGYSLGPEMGANADTDGPLEVIATPIAAAKAAQSIATNELKQLKEAEAREARCKAGDTAQCPTDEERKAAQAQFNSQVRELAEASCAAAARCGTERPATEATASASGEQDESGGKEEDSDSAASHSNPVKGSGGVLPAGAPPWLVDLVRMILTYFGIDQAVENAVLALYLIAPDIVNNLAETSAGLTKDLDSDALNSAFEAARQLYQLYNALQGMSADLNKVAKDANFSSVAEMVKTVAGRIDELPEPLKNDLQQSLQGDLKGLADTLGTLGSVDLKDFEAVLQGDEAALDQLKRRVDKKAREHVQKVTERAIAKEITRTLKLPPGIAERALRSNPADLTNTLKQELITEGARQMKVDATALKNFVASDAATQRRAVEVLVADHASRVVDETLKRQGVNLKDAQHLSDALAHPSANTLQPLLNERFPAQASLLTQAAQAARDPQSLASTQAKKALRQQLSSALSPAALDALLAGSSAAAVVDAELTARGLSGDAAIRDTTRRIEAQIAAVTGEQVRLLPEDLPSWLSSRLSRPLSDTDMKMLTDETLASIQQTAIRATAAAPLGAEFGVGCSATTMSARPEDFQVVKDGLKNQVQRITRQPAVALEAADTIATFCREARPMIAAALAELATAPAQIVSDGRSASLLVSMAWKESLAGARPADVETLRRFTGSVSVSQLAAATPEEAYANLSRLVSEQAARNPAWLGSEVSALARLSTNQAFADALYGSATPDYPRAMRIVMAPLLAQDAPLARWEPLLFGATLAQRRDAAYALLTTYGISAAQAQIHQLPATGTCEDHSMGAVEVDPTGSVGKLCSFDAVVEYLLDRVTAGGREVLVSKAVVRELAQGRLTQGASWFVKQLICERAEKCDPTRARQEIRASTQRDLAIKELAGQSLLSSLDHLKADSLAHEVLIDEQIRKVASEALNTPWCGKRPPNELAACAGSGVMCYSNKLQDAAVIALEACAAPAVPTLSQSHASAVNIERLKKVLALGDCRRVMPGEQEGGVLSVDAVIDRCKRAVQQ